MNSYLGIDTSNYTTSAALYFSNNSFIHNKKLLSVKNGNVGLRQSEAVFQHVNQLPEVIKELIRDYNKIPKAIGVSKSPRDVEGSYMPCFTVGLSTSKILSSFFDIPLYEFSHQAGHIVSALYSANKLYMLRETFLAFHISGGTTEAIMVTPSDLNVINCNVIASTLDLNAGQVIDRIGVMLGMKFPSGAYLDALACTYKGDIKVRPTLKGANCCLSGLENLCVNMRKNGEEDNKIARFCIEYISETIDIMCQKLLNKHGDIPVLFTGGVMSNTIIRENLSEKYNAIFATPQLSSDNAVGIAILAAAKVGDI